MMKPVRVRLNLLACCLLACVVVLLYAAVPATQAERLAQARNLGKAFYENPTTGAEAVTEFRRALNLAPNSTREKLNYALALLKAGKSDEAVDLLKKVQKLDPSLPHTWFNLGIYYRKNGEEQLAIEQFRGMLKLTPDEPIAHYQLGALLKQIKDTSGAIAQFERMEELNPLLAGGHFQLYNLYRQSGRTADAARELNTFQELKKQQENAAIPEDLEWCDYAEIYDPPAARASNRVERQAAPDDRTIPGTVDPRTAGLTAIDTSGKGEIDLLVWSSRGAALYRRGAGLATDSGLEGLRDVMDIAPGDFDNDGLMDLCVLTPDGPTLYRNTGGKFVKFSANLPRRRFQRAVWIDYDHDSDLDLVLVGDAPALLRNQGPAGFADRTADFPFAAGHATDAWKLRAVPDTKSFDLAVTYSDHAAVQYRDELGGRYKATPSDLKPRAALEADFPDMGPPARVRIAADGSIHLTRNRAAGHWIRVQLSGIKSLKLAQDAEVEIKAGSLYTKRLYEGVPLVFDTGDYTSIDVVRITWPNGLIQNETRQPADKNHRYEESQRLSGSCPMIWTWNGSGFEFVADVLGVAPLGASDGDGSYFPVNHVEYVLIPGHSLHAANGRLDVRITEELSEVTYLDQAELYAVDHPAGTEIYTNVKFQSPPYPDLRLYGAANHVYPRTARDDKGRDVLPQILRADGQAPDGFQRTPSGVAEMHSLELDFGDAAPSGKATLLLHGWVDWADGSTFRAASQESAKGLVVPYLEMQDASGHWKVVNPDMGMPSGKPRTIAVDLKFPSASRKVRIGTNMCVYWDEIFLSPETAEPTLHRQQAKLSTADLHFRGFSASRVDPARRHPDTYSYKPLSATSFWNPTPGFYTRYGDVRELTEQVDDKFVILGSGDELRLSFDAAVPGAVPAGWVRDYLLKVDGWAKDRDANTAFSSTVEPLPFHVMSVYPYPASEHYPDDESHRQYRREYNVRPALRLIRPLSD
jgi:tetratricopeptide (TPR) repeat protein